MPSPNARLLMSRSFAPCLAVNSPAVVRHANVDAILTGAGRRTPSHSFFPRRGAGVAEQGCLLSSYPDKIGIGGSNPPLSASSHIAHAYTDQNHRNEIAPAQTLRPATATMNGKIVPRERPGSSV